MSKTVFFGPFIGEFGWELSYWHGWVRKVCQTEFRDFRKIASSFPGREPLYPLVDEFWPLPKTFLSLCTSGHGYYTDGWRGGYPGIQYEGYNPVEAIKAVISLKKPERTWLEKPVEIPDIEQKAEAVLDEFTKKLPGDTVYFVPWKPNRYEPDALEFGVFAPRDQKLQSCISVARPIGFGFQRFEPLRATPAAEFALDNIAPADNKKLIAIFPRCRKIRRSDKNWPAGNYLELIQALQREWPEYRVAIFGEPGGAYFSDGVPPGCMDLINVPPERRMDIQVAALKRCIMAIGSVSGGLLLPFHAGCPTVLWGHRMWLTRYGEHNVQNTPMFYYPEMHPSVKEILNVLEGFHYFMLSYFRNNPANPTDKP